MSLVNVPTSETWLKRASSALEAIKRLGNRPKMILRIGRQELSLWSDTHGKLRLIERHATSLNGASGLNESDATELLNPLESLLSHCPAPCRLDFIIESAHMPTCLLRTGDKLWSAHQVQAMTTHHLSLTYGDDARQWLTQSTYLAGDPHALAFGLPRDLYQVLRRAADKQSISIHSIQPALTWGWDRLISSACPTWACLPVKAKNPRTFWWIWPEQDRDLVAYIQNGRIAGFNPAAPSSQGSTEQLKRITAIEAVRLGVLDTNVPVRAAKWEHAEHVHSDAAMAATDGWVQGVRCDVLTDTVSSNRRVPISLERVA